MAEGALFDHCCTAGGYFTAGGELSKPSLHMRPGLTTGIRSLAMSFQLVVA
eukprot:COSAG01_NODE_63726_length_279_cov_0.566667_1_plen_50_part_10